MSHELIDKSRIPDLHQVKKKYEIYYLLGFAQDVDSLKGKIESILKSWGIAEYSFYRVAVSNHIDPTLLLSNIGNEGSSDFLRPVINDDKTKHLSMLYYYLAGLPEDSISEENDLYVFLAFSDITGCYITSESLFESANLNSINQDQNLYQLLQSLVLVVQNICLNRFSSYVKTRENDSEKIQVKSRPLKLLNVLATKDMTLRQAAELLCISVDTANKHMASSKSALGTKSISGTIWKATQAGLIDRQP